MKIGLPRVRLRSVEGSGGSFKAKGFGDGQAHEGSPSGIFVQTIPKAEGLEAATRSPTAAFLPASRKLASFCAFAKRSTLLVPRPTRHHRELALFRRGPLPVQFIITLFPHSAYPSYRSGAIGFVSHVLAQRLGMGDRRRPAPIPHVSR